MLVLLTHANHLYFDPKQVRKMQPYPPLQTLIAAAVLRRAGFGVAFFDSTFDADAAQAIARVNPDLVFVCEDHFNFLTKMCLLRNREFALSIAAAAKRAGIPAAVSSSDSADHVPEYLAGGFDWVLLGEVEQTLLELVTALANRAPVDTIPGLHALQHAAPPRPPSSNLDLLPQPAWDLAPLDDYRRAWREAHGYFTLNLVSSRGCPYHCNWCAKPIYGDAYHSRSPELVAEEMRHVREAYQPDRIWFADDIFALSPKWTLRFAEEVEARRAQIPFKMQSRCDLMTRDTVAALRRAGCDEVWMGAESGSQKVLDAMEKGVRVEQIYRARENLRRHGIRACFFLQFGYPGETREDIERTVRMVRETKPDDIGVSVSYPLPKTKFYNLVANQLGAKSNWSHSGDLAVMFRAAFPSDYYRSLAESLHSEVKSWAG